ncbi:MAG: mannose-1-phosphate guanylyltransferase [Candidatus Omnitrophica bacterium]|nr:mannose-1-phosphate guanylyltransferase [Candidatus Omnitrophota bacterium]
MKQLYAVILAGGSGHRLWPQSRKHLPKQLIRIAGSSQTLLRQTVQRIARIVPKSRILIVTHKDQARQIRKQRLGLPGENILAEPYRRNTAAALALAGLELAHRDPEAVLWASPADHVIGRLGEYERVVRLAARTAADHNALVTLGLKPAYPTPEYGYIVPSKKQRVAGTARKGVWPVARFVEKPPAEQAALLIERNRALWNSGIFFWKVGVYERALSMHMPRLHRVCAQLQKIWGKRGAVAKLDSLYVTLPGVSVDKGVLEKTKKVLTVEANLDWVDVGSWRSLESLVKADGSGNVGLGTTLALDSKGCVFAGEQDHLIAAVGLEDVIVVHTEDATLVCKKSEAHRVKEIVESLKGNKLGRYA